MPSLTLSYEELEALNDVLEAARCFWHPQRANHQRAAKTLRLASSLYWRLGEALPKTGNPSKRFLPVKHSPQGDRVEQLLAFILDLTRQYSNSNDPWWADTVFASTSLIAAFTQEQLHELRDSLGRLGLTLEFHSDILKDQMVAGRQDLGPWPEETRR